MKSTPQVISANEAYTVAEFRRRAALGDFSFRKAKAAGLPVHEFGKKRYVFGRDWLALLDSHPAPATPMAAGGDQPGSDSQ